MDNTFFDFVHAKIKACQAVIDHLKIDEKAESELLQYFLRDKGIENLENIADYLKDRNIYSEKSFKNCSEIYEKTKIDNINLYEGVLETLGQLRSMGLTLAVVTDADCTNAMLRINKTGLADFFDLIVTIEVTEKKKPQPDSFLYALKKLDLKPEKTILVGDSLRRDIEPAKKLGMITAYAAYGDRNFFEEKNVTSDFVLKKLGDIIGILNEF